MTIMPMQRRKVESLSKCHQCPLEGYKYVLGEGPDACDVMIVGQAPGKTEVSQGRPFVGQAGRILNAAIDCAGWDRKKIYITNTVKCRPSGDAMPCARTIRACKGSLRAEIKRKKPILIICMGIVATHVITGDKSPLYEIREKDIFWHKGIKSFVLATNHPTARKQVAVKEIMQDFTAARKFYAYLTNRLRTETTRYADPRASSPHDLPQTTTTG